MAIVRAESEKATPLGWATGTSIARAAPRVLALPRLWQLSAPELNPLSQPGKRVRLSRWEPVSSTERNSLPCRLPRLCLTLY